ncbi:MAG: ComEC/Rec2 family competence protein [Bacteroidales bacterium]
MNIWNHYPFFRLIVPLALGIIAAIEFGMPEDIPLLYPVIFSAGLLVFVFAAHFLKSYALRWLPGLVIYVFTFAAGYTLTLVRTSQHHQYHFKNHLSGDAVFLIRILEPLQEKPNSRRTVAEVMAIRDSTGRSATTGKTLVYLEKTPAAYELKYGDVLLTDIVPAPVAHGGNPHQFDYRRFLANDGIYHQMYIGHEQWAKVDSNRVNPLFELAYSARERMLGVLRENGFAGDELAVVSAVLLGYDEYMEPELRDHYAGAGAMHVLCVSGLHVGIVFFILNFFLKGLDRRRSTRILKMLLLLAGIWMYAMITGLSPSVMRAAVMFSLFAWREVRREKSNPYNILAASAFILLIANPYLITKIGFQLSYAAVLAIIALYRPVYRLATFKNAGADYLWKLTSVSLCAQIGTFPLAIYYFNQFPTYFFLTNLFAIPLVWLVVNTGIIMLLVSFVWNLLAVKLGFILYLFAYLLNYFVELINAIPGARIAGLTLGFWQMVVVYALIIFTVRFLIKKRGGYLVAAASLSLLLTGTFLLNRYQRLQQEEIVIYQVNRHSAIDLIHGRSAVMLADSSLFADERTIGFNLEGHRIHAGISRIFPANFQPYAMEALQTNGLPFRYHSQNFMSFGNRKIALVDKDFPEYDPRQPLKVDVVLLRNNPRIQPGQIDKWFDFDYLVADASNHYRLRNEFAEYFSDSLFHDVKEEGAFVLSKNPPLIKIP